MTRFQIISHIKEKIKLWVGLAEKRDIFVALVVILTALSAFFIGRISRIETDRPPVVIRQFPAVQSPVQVPKKTAVTAVASQTAAVGASSGAVKGIYVASKNGTKYHLPNCIGAKSISDANKIWFATKADAEKAGYTPAGNCKGI
ncbi:MAG TPA: hypothetical protein VIR98_00940 [Candidatus Paceibacterota bacterium]